MNQTEQYASYSLLCPQGIQDRQFPMNWLWLLQHVQWLHHAEHDIHVLIFPVRSSPVTFKWHLFSLSEMYLWHASYRKRLNPHLHSCMTRIDEDETDSRLAR